MFIYRDLRCWTLFFAVPYAVELSVLMGVEGWSCPNSSKVVLNMIASWLLTKSALVSASAADAMTFFMMEETTCKGQFGGGSLTGGFVLPNDAELR